MKPEEVISYSPKDVSSSEGIVDSSIRNALISLCFFGDPFNSENIATHVSRRIRDRIVMWIFSLFAKENQLDLVFQHEQLPHWKTAKYDFSYKNTAWNFIVNSIHAEENLTESETLKLPALVPNRFEADLWNERKIVPEQNSSSKFLFAFTYEKEWKNLTKVISEMLTPSCLSFLKKTTYGNMSQSKSQHDFDESGFWNTFEENGKIPVFHFEQFPTLLICGVAGEKEYPFFANTDSDSEHGYALFTGRYYEHKIGGGLSFLDGTIITEFRNATCPVGALPSFRSIIQSENKE